MRVSYEWKENQTKPTELQRVQEGGSPARTDVELSLVRPEHTFAYMIDFQR